MSEPSVDVRSLLLPFPASSGSGTEKTPPKRRRKKPDGPKPGTPEWWERWIQRWWSWGLVIGEERATGAPVTKSNERYDLWTCTACGAPMIFSRPPGRHAGPAVRALDPRYGYAQCWRVSEAWRLIKDQPHREGVATLHRHDSRPQSSQPAQASSLLDLPSSFKDPSRTYGTFPGHNRRGPSRLEGATRVVVPTVVPKGGTVTITALVSTVPDPSSLTATLDTLGSPSTDGSQQPSDASSTPTSAALA